MEFIHFTINFFNTKKACFDEKLTTCKRSLLLPYIYYNNLIYYTTITENLENINEIKNFKVYNNHNI